MSGALFTDGSALHPQWPQLRRAGWSVVQVDNDGEKGGGWAHDLLNDAVFARMLADARAGAFLTLMIAFPCSSSSAFFVSCGSSTVASILCRSVRHLVGLAVVSFGSSNML